ncbi:MAG: hypothetical protein EHM13_13410 [Acidobacteria bacterium]|nr:MAG: hypothetical protein EHM13_13410 [Acidobacteriota bacterium]
MQKRAFVLVTVVVALTVGLAAQRGGGRGRMGERPTLTAYDSDEYRLAFVAPTDMYLYSAQQPGKYEALFAKRHLAVLVNPLAINETIDVRYSGRLTEADVQGFRQAMEKNPPQAKLPGFERLTLETVKIGRGQTKEAVNYVYKARPDKADEVVRQVVFVHAGNGFMITCTAEAKRQEQASKMVDRFLESVEFR